MSSVTVRPGQTLADIAVEQTGTAESVYSIAAANGLSVTDELVAGTILTVDVATSEARAQRFYQLRKLSPAANITIPPRDGIGVWVIGSNFTIT